MAIVVNLEIDEFILQIGRIPGQSLVKKLVADSSDQALNEGIGWRMLDRSIFHLTTFNLGFSVSSSKSIVCLNRSFRTNAA